jgi:1-acyl-sn-glycerol-3-phosphate acyltransferase
MPILGWMCRLNRTVFVRRDSRRNAAEQINVLREAMADNWSVTIFPEGTVTDGHSMLPFKSSMLSVLESPPSGILVQPLVLDYGKVAEWIGWLGQESGIDNARRIFARPGTFTVDLHFLDPLDPREYHGRKAISAETRQRIETVLIAGLGKPLRPYRFDVPMVGFKAARDEPLDSA